MSFAIEPASPIVKIKGRSVEVTMVNPYLCYLVAHYSNGSTVRGRDLFESGWKELPSDIASLQYVLSTGKVINIPSEFTEYLHLIDASQSVYGERMFHNVFIKGVTPDGRVVSYRIVLREHDQSEYKIGDVVVSLDESKLKSPYWKSAIRG